MTLTKTLLIFATAGFLAACEDGMAPAGGGGGMAMSGGMDESLVRDSRLSGRLDGAVTSGNTVVYSYYTDVIDDGTVLNGADVYCSGPGQAVIDLTRGDRGGRGYNTMAFTCR